MDKCWKCDNIELDFIKNYEYENEFAEIEFIDAYICKKCGTAHWNDEDGWHYLIYGKSDNETNPAGEYSTDYSMALNRS